MTPLESRYEPPFRFEPNPVKYNFLGKAFKKLTKEHPLAVKVASWALLAFTFLCFAMAVTAFTVGMGIGGLVAGLALLPVSLEAHKLRRELAERAFRGKILDALGKSGVEFPKEKVIELPNNRLESLKVEDLGTDKFKVGKDSDGRLFVVYRVREGEIEYIEALHQKESGEWGKKGKLHAVTKEKVNWEQWKLQPSVFSNYEKKLSEKEIATLKGRLA